MTCPVFATVCSPCKPPKMTEWEGKWMTAVNITSSQESDLNHYWKKRKVIRNLSLNWSEIFQSNSKHHIRVMLSCTEYLWVLTYERDDITSGSAFFQDLQAKWLSENSLTESDVQPRCFTSSASVYFCKYTECLFWIWRCTLQSFTCKDGVSDTRDCI